MGESILLALVALLFAVVLIEVSLPAFNAFTQRELVLDYTGNWHVVFALLGIALFAGLLSGVYPALFLSAFQPVEVLKSTLRRGLKTSNSRKTLVVFQFVISIVLIIGTVVVYHQSDYIKNKKLGFNKEQVVVIPIDRQLAKRYKPTVVSVCSGIKCVGVFYRTRPRACRPPFPPFPGSHTQRCFTDKRDVCRSRIYPDLWY